MEKHIKQKKIFGFVALLCGTLWILNTTGLLIGLLTGYESFGEHFNKPNILDGEEISPMSLLDWKFNFWAAVFSLIMIRFLGGKISRITLNGYTPQEAEMPTLNSRLESKNNSVLDNELQKNEPEQEIHRNAEIEKSQISLLYFYKYTQSKKAIITTTRPLAGIRTKTKNIDGIETPSNDPVLPKLRFGFTVINPELADQMNLQVGDPLPLEITDKVVVNSATGEIIPNLYWAH